MFGSDNGAHRLEIATGISGELYFYFDWGGKCR